MGKYDFEEESSDSDIDGFLQDEIQALSGACMPSITSDGTGHPLTNSAGADYGDFSEDDDDLELVRNIKEQYGAGVDITQPLSLKPLTSLPPVTSDDDEDDFETLRAIQRRFSQYGVGDTDGSSESKNDSCINKSLSNDAIGMSMGNESSNVLKDDVELEPRDMAENGETSGCTSSFPRAAQTFIEAIKKNRSCQKFIRNKMLHLEARMEEIKELQKRLKTLRDFQVRCKKKIGRALSQKQDARIQLISAPKQRANSKGIEKNASATYYGPLENSHVACYKNALTNFPLSFQREKWSKEERQNLEKGIIQQFQEMLLQKSADVLSALEEPDFANGVDGMISSITNVDITPKIIQDFSGKVNWDQLASMYVPCRSGAECESRWWNYENRLINRDNWTPTEDKQLLLFIQQNGIHNWSCIAEKLKTNRTAFQCLTRYQRSLNASILKRDWTEEEDAQLRSAVESFGESNWQAVASVLEGRTGTQCSNRWKKTLHPARHRVGKWSDDEDKRLRVAVTLFGHKSWHKIAQFVPGRTQVQCRERWVNVLDPSLNRGEWTEEDDLKLKAAIAEHGYCWSRVAASVPLRTDNQCRRRWKQLFPHEVPLLKAARNIQKAALISNFVDRESERPALGPNDFVPLPIEGLTNDPDVENIPQKQKSRKSREANPTKMTPCLKGVRSRKRRKSAGSRETNMNSDCGDAQNIQGSGIFENKKRASRSSSKKKRSSASLDIATEPQKKLCESKESDETEEIETWSGRPQGVRSKEIMSSHCGLHQEDTSIIYDADIDKTTHMPFLEQNNDPETLHDQSTFSNPQSRINDSVLRKQSCSKLQPERFSAESSIRDNNCLLELKSNDGTESHCGDATGSIKRKQNARKPHKKSMFRAEQSEEWEDLPLAILFNWAVARIQRRKFSDNHLDDEGAAILKPALRRRRVILRKK